MSNVDIGRYSKRIVQLFWDPEPKNDDITKAPIWCLGRKYDCRPNDPWQHVDHDSPSVTPRSSGPHTENQSVRDDDISESYEKLEVALAEQSPPNDEWPRAFLDDFESRIWFTYRSGFPPIPKAEDPKAVTSMSFKVRLASQILHKDGFTSDTGWGCMIRSGQSLLANALTRISGKETKFLPAPDIDGKRLLSWFADDPRAPFSIHRFVEYGARACGTYPGQWFGPSATARCIENLCAQFPQAGLRVYISEGPDVFEDKLLEVSKGDHGEFRPTLLLVGTRLGIDRVTPVYREALLLSLQLPQSLGIAGGSPSSSHYFVGTQGYNFFYLDPHQTRPALPYRDEPAAYTAEEIESCHTRRLRRMSVEDLDPSMMIGFLFTSEMDWLAWKQSVSDSCERAIFTVSDTAASSQTCGTERERALDEVETFDDEDISSSEGILFVPANQV